MEKVKKEGKKMKLNEFMKDYSLKGYDIEFKDVYGNSYKKNDLYAKTILKIENLEIRDVHVYFRLKKATFCLINLYELMKEEEIK